MGSYQIDYDKLIISDIRFNDLKKEVYAKFDDPENKSDWPDLPENSKLKEDLLNEIKFKKALFIKITAIIFYSDNLLPESKSPPTINYSLPFSEYPNIIFENDIIRNFFENICIAFRSSLDILTHLFSLKVKSIPKIPKNIEDNYQGFKKGKKKSEWTISKLEKEAPTLYTIFQKHIDWIDKLCNYRDMIIHKQGYLDINYWIKVQNNQSITWTSPSIDTGESLELFTIKIRNDIMYFYKEILDEYDKIEYLER
jgi:hypothetical protein